MGGIIALMSGSGPVNSGQEPSLESFDPESLDSNVYRWLNNINWLGRIHDWADYEKMHFKQLKLMDPAKAWFHRLDEYDRSWEEMSVLHHAFYQQHDFTEMMEELVTRKKMPAGTMMLYIHVKLVLIHGEEGTVLHHLGTPLGATSEHTCIQLLYG